MDHHPGYAYVLLAFEISLGGNDFLFGGSFLSRGFLGDDFALTLTVALALAITIAAGAVIFAGALAVAIALAISAVIAAAQQLLGPGNDLIAVGGDHINNTGDGGQSSHDLQQSSNNFHIRFLLNNNIKYSITAAAKKSNWQFPSSGKIYK
jgi:hypothetical protein